jgi:hypothetical protein
MFAACDVVPAPNGSKAGPVASIGRYTFSTEPSTTDHPGAQYLLDTSTGDVWLLKGAVDSGALGSAVLEPVMRQSHNSPGTVGRFTVTEMPCEDAYQQYLRSRTKK